MLSKSQAKAFFLIGTAVCSIAMVGLTIDTFRRIPEQTKQANMTEAVIRGKHLFDRNNCMGCHTLLGEGGYYAPELTKVMERRGEAFVRAMIKDPEAMYPGQRKMQSYKFSEEQISDLVAFLTWIGDMDLNGFPPKPDLVNTAAANAGINASESQAVVKKTDRPQVFNQMCIACHALEGQGGAIGPALDGVGSKFDAAYIKAWLTDPLAIKANSKMPKMPLTENDIIELTAFLSLLKETK